MRSQVQISLILAFATQVLAQAQPWGQCGGNGWTGPTSCVSGWCCQASNEWYSQCIQGSCGGGATTTTTVRTTITSAKTTTPATTTRTTTSSGANPTTSSGSGTCSGSSAAVNQLQGYGTGTTGGGSGSGTTVTSCSALEAALSGTTGGVIRISGLLNGCGTYRVPSDTTIVGVGSNSGMVNGGLYVRRVSNVIIRNLKLSPPAKGDAVNIDGSARVWVDHCEFYSLGLVGGKDDFDGLLDVNHGSDFVTISWNKFRDHWKGSLVGHSDNNASEDTGKLHVTYHHNSFTNVNSRLPSVRFGTAHIFSNCYSNIPTSGINSRMGAQVLVEQNHFRNTQLAIVTNLDSDYDGYAVHRNNIFDSSNIRITQVGSFSSPPYSYTASPACRVCDLIASSAGTGVISV
ncbi:hypothetical protein AOL_s00043g817 [Orbilia oligospora ATCC 24927]|uniref:CBM1 domain-containing protein n=2 Tax=Orbilia oligospora TaxID=2813651 RepID=G1X543_ARTOA|nr:hypothetical protein AOL_s00043g817 [Orbilia oligospora ATCC 24927]EGX51798.1 hypothetical protein AOL_s00043g817 [Orbilia oligospora ATCC 24927]KAF3273411.1 hypothetical protein TWF970_009072 [Orbilia oligospora]